MRRESQKRRIFRMASWRRKRTAVIRNEICIGSDIGRGTAVLTFGSNWGVGDAGGYFFCGARRKKVTPILGINFLRPDCGRIWGDDLLVDMRNCCGSFWPACSAS